jgi:hypothetical protein
VCVRSSEENLESKVDEEVRSLTLSPGGKGEDTTRTPDGAGGGSHGFFDLDVLDFCLSDVVASTHAKDEQTGVLMDGGSGGSGECWMVGCEM